MDPETATDLIDPKKPADIDAIGRKRPRIFLTIYEKSGPNYTMATTDGAGDDDTGETALQTPIEDARDELQRAIPEAADTLRDLLDADDERVQLRAAEAVLDRAGLTKADKWSNLKAQVQVGGGEREGEGFRRTDPLEDGEDDLL